MSGKKQKELRASPYLPETCLALSHNKLYGERNFSPAPVQPPLVICISGWFGKYTAMGAEKPCTSHSRHPHKKSVHYMKDKWREKELRVDVKEDGNRTQPTLK